ncbi:MAG: radical SAM protein [Proteobacteria bacterium]|nr:radical SAM protein [Pseudomonadota bacterium]
MPRVLLIRTDSRSIPRVLSPPLGIMYLASALKFWARHDFQVEVFDQRLFRKPFPALQRWLQEFRPDLVGLSTLTFEDREMRQTADLVKKFSPRCPVIVGGPHGTIFYPEILTDGNIDFVVVGEGEKSFVELADALAEDGKNVPPPPGVAYRQEEKAVFPGGREPITDPDSIPFPAWDLVDLDRYPRFADFNGGLGKGRYMGIFTSRACPYQCIYCHSVFGKGFRARSPENVMKEIDTLVSQFQVKEFQVFDDCFNLDRDRVIAIAKLIVDRDYGIRLSFTFGLRGDLLDEEVLTWLRRAGGYSITIAIETASPRLQEMIGKNLDLEKVKAAIVTADRLGFLVKGLFMLGFPTETREELEATARLARELPLFNASFFTVVPFAKTPMWEMFQTAYPGYNIDYQHHHYLLSKDRNPFYPGAGVNLRRFQKSAHVKFYLFNPGRIIKAFIRAPNPWGYLLRNILRGIRIVLFH